MFETILSRPFGWPRLVQDRPAQQTPSVQLDAVLKPDKAYQTLSPKMGTHPALAV
jgi:hypothetical protein